MSQPLPLSRVLDLEDHGRILLLEAKIGHLLSVLGELVDLHAEEEAFPHVPVSAKRWRRAWEEAIDVIYDHRADRDP